MRYLDFPLHSEMVQPMRRLLAIAAAAAVVGTALSAALALAVTPSTVKFGAITA